MPRSAAIGLLGREAGLACDARRQDDSGQKPKLVYYPLVRDVFKSGYLLGVSMWGVEA